MLACKHNQASNKIQCIASTPDPLERLVFCCCITTTTTHHHHRQRLSIHRHPTPRLGVSSTNTYVPQVSAMLCRMPCLA